MKKKEPSDEKNIPAGSKLYIINNKVYDLSDWAHRHPGGSMWFDLSHGRDITTTVQSYHKDPEKLEEILEGYEVDPAPEDVLDKTLNVPAFILPPDFDARRDVQRFDWNAKNFLFSLNKKIYSHEMQTKIARADFRFDIIGAGILIFHIFMMFVGVYYEVLPVWAFVILFVVTRTSLASIGHYHCHRKKDGISDWGDGLFDMQYVGAHTVLFDGHTLLHHAYTNSPADVKRTVFAGVLQLPRLWRVPIHTLHRLGHLVSGMFIRRITAMQKVNYPTIKQLQFLFIRLLLVGELVFCFYTENMLMWSLQFALSLWLNLFLIVSSHDFEESETKADLKHGQDWGIFQIKNSFDMKIIGNPYIDCFLTAGLGSHRVHHVLPAQRSGFSNILSERALRETCEEFNVPWLPTKSFLFDRFPKLFSFYMFTPMQSSRFEYKGFFGFLRETFSIEGLKRMIYSIYVGFKGIGSI
uniref:Fatty acid desaturase n=1 Tax=Candidatus Kentrum sp. FW TaxID=2126338 RepID=A0A450T4D9_9GAMM|nr:MAG: Fatty acid desaturase [Candidatus Kentron sp. FW]